ncbi:MAG: hypothetical protein NTY91_02065, partial [Euryarchaeota archaeon]|nr:hypothetical protein [Euryarchaeota archaeon]
MSRKTKRSFLATLVLISILATTPAAFATSSATYVSEQKTHDEYHENISLQEMINSAEPGTTIQLPSGTYTEILTINKPL